MYIKLDYQSGEAIYRQIIEQVKYKVASGELMPGEKLPSIRELAKDLKIHPQTVVKTYEQLEAAGLVVVRHGQGVFVADNQAALPQAVRRGQIEDMARRLVSEAARLGADNNEIIEIVIEIAEKMRHKDE